MADTPTPEALAQAEAICMAYTPVYTHWGNLKALIADALTAQAQEIERLQTAYSAIADELNAEIDRLREGLDLSWEEAINAVPSKCEGLSVCEPMCHDNIQADLRAARAAAQGETP